MGRIGVAPRVARWPRAPVFFVILLGGCVAPDPGGSARDESAIPPPAYVCPEDRASTAPCLSAVAPVGRFYEPAAAAHPSASGTFALAATRLGRAANHHTAAVPPGHDPNLCRVVVHLTTDGGATWRASGPTLPPWGMVDGEPVRDRCARSPDVAFDAAGVLHVVVNDFARTWTASVTSTPESASRLAQRVLHLRSDDLGETWTALVLREDANHPYVAFDAATGVLVVTVRELQGDGFSRSAVAWSLDGGARWSDPATVPCHLPTRAVFDGGRAVFACTDPGAMANGRLIRFYALDPATGAVETRGEVPVPGARNLFTALARASDGRIALAWTPTVPGGEVDGDPHVAVAGTCCDFGPAVNVREPLAPDRENAMWTTVRADADGTFHFGVEAWRGRDAAFFHATIAADGAVASSALVHAWTWTEWPPTDPGPDPVETYLGEWRGSLYPAFAFQGASGILGTTANDAGSLRVARIVRGPE